MADSSLDEFFAKKDKSKKGKSGKSKAKYTTTDTIAKKLEESGKKGDSTPKKDIKEKTVITSTQPAGGTVTVPVTSEQEDDEWKVEEERERDYSGLRIQALSISEKEKEEEQLKEQMLSEQNGEASKTADGQPGPWKVMSSVPAEIEEAPSTPEPVVKEESKPQAYKPPALRNAQPAVSTGGGSARRNPKSAPQISSELHFPSLSAAVESSKGKYSESDRSFQSVKHGVRSKGESHQGLHLDLENKFSALHQGD